MATEQQCKGKKPRCRRAAKTSSIREIILALYPDALVRTYCVPPVHFNRIQYTRTRLAGLPVLLRHETHAHLGVCDTPGVDFMTKGDSVHSASYSSEDASTSKDSKHSSPNSSEDKSTPKDSAHSVSCSSEDTSTFKDSILSASYSSEDTPTLKDSHCSTRPTISSEDTSISKYKTQFTTFPSGDASTPKDSKHSRSYSNKGVTDSNDSTHSATYSSEDTSTSRDSTLSREGASTSRGTSHSSEDDPASFARASIPSSSDIASAAHSRHAVDETKSKTKSPARPTHKQQTASRPRAPQQAYSMWPHEPEVAGNGNGGRRMRQVQTNDVQDDAAQQLVLANLQALGNALHQPMFILSQFSFDDYLCNQRASREPRLPRVSDLDVSLRRGDLDVLVIHRRYGLAVGEVKSVGWRGEAEDEDVGAACTRPWASWARRAPS